MCKPAPHPAQNPTPVTRVSPPTHPPHHATHTRRAERGDRRSGTPRRPCAACGAERRGGGRGRRAEKGGEEGNAARVRRPPTPPHLTPCPPPFTRPRPRRPAMKERKLGIGGGQGVEVRKGARRIGMRAGKRAFPAGASGAPSAPRGLLPHSQEPSSIYSHCDEGRGKMGSGEVRIGRTREHRGARSDMVIGHPSPCRHWVRAGGTGSPLPLPPFSHPLPLPLPPPRRWRPGTAGTRRRGRSCWPRPR